RAVAALTAVPQDRGETKSYIKPDMIGHHGSLRRAAKGRKRRGHQWTPAAAQHHRLCGRKKSGLFLANPNGAVAAVSATALDGHDRQSAVGDETAETRLAHRIRSDIEIAGEQQRSIQRRHEMIQLVQLTLKGIIRAVKSHASCTARIEMRGHNYERLCNAGD